jgi:catechol 2,3-dioxygenase-like lactoylglutathione lyase family enzyme
MIAPIAIDHTCLVVRSLPRSQAFYEALFDFTFAPREGDPRTLAVESVLVHFFMTQVPDAPAEFLRCQHLSFRVKDLEPVMARLEAAGHEFTFGEVTFFKQNNYRWCEWRDPDGIRLECVSPL